MWPQVKYLFNTFVSNEKNHLTSLAFMATWARVRFDFRIHWCYQCNYFCIRIIPIQILYNCLAVVTRFSFTEVPFRPSVMFNMNKQVDTLILLLYEWLRNWRFKNISSFSLLSYYFTWNMKIWCRIWSTSLNITNNLLIQSPKP